MAERMFPSLEEIFQHASEAHKTDLGVQDWHNRLRQADENSRRGLRDVEILKWIRTVLDQLRVSDTEDLLDAANVLANGSRDGICTPIIPQVIILTSPSILAITVGAIRSS